MIKKIKTTTDEYIESLSPSEKEQFDKEYKELLLSEMLLAVMEQDEVSVRRLAKLAGISPSIIQGVRSGSKKDINLKSFFKILKGMGYNKILGERDGNITTLISLNNKLN